MPFAVDNPEQVSSLSGMIISVHPSLGVSVAFDSVIIEICEKFHCLLVLNYDVRYLYAHDIDFLLILMY